MKTGFIGWRGMVGSVLLERMVEERDFVGLDARFFSTSSPGGPGPDVGSGPTVLGDAYDVQQLARCEVLVSCQGGAYTQTIEPALRASGWHGYWIDAASTLRMNDDATLVLDPVNGRAVRSALASGMRTFVGANCTVSLLLMALAGLIESGHVQWITTASYQAASGGGAAKVRELVAQFAYLGNAGAGSQGGILDLDSTIAAALVEPDFPTAEFGAPLAASALPWIDSAHSDGQTREEWKAMAEGNKLLDRQDNPLPIDGVCVRIGAMRCHAQAVTLKLDRDLPLGHIADLIEGAHQWACVVPNTKDSTLARLTPAAVAGTLTVPVGRLRKLALGPEYISLFTVGDQLLWGAAEPLRRMLAILRE